MYNAIEWRNCQFCKQGAQVYRDGVYELVKYGIRHYAHPCCLATRKGRNGGRALIPEHEHNSYDAALADADDTTNALADHVDTVNARKAAAP